MVVIQLANTDPAMSWGIEDLHTTLAIFRVCVSVFGMVMGIEWGYDEDKDNINAATICNE